MTLTNRKKDRKIWTSCNLPLKQPSMQRYVTDTWRSWLQTGAKELIKSLSWKGKHHLNDKVIDLWNTNEEPSLLGGGCEHPTPRGALHQTTMKMQQKNLPLKSMKERKQLATRRHHIQHRIQKQLNGELVVQAIEPGNRELASENEIAALDEGQWEMNEKCR